MTFSRKRWLVCWIVQMVASFIDFWLVLFAVEMWNGDVVSCIIWKSVVEKLWYGDDLLFIPLTHTSLSILQVCKKKSSQHSYSSIEKLHQMLKSFFPDRLQKYLSKNKIWLIDEWYNCCECAKVHFVLLFSCLHSLRWTEVHT